MWVIIINTFHLSNLRIQISEIYITLIEYLGDNLIVWKKIAKVYTMALRKIPLFIEEWDGNTKQYGVSHSTKSTLLI